MAVMTPITLWLALTDAVADCGCFGDAIVLTNWQTFAKNIVLLVIAVATLLIPSMDIRFVSCKVRKILAVLGTVGIIALIGHCLYWLPIIDFRPFNVGADIRAKMELPDDGTMPEILDFCIETLDGEDVTETVLDSKDVVLLIAPFLQTACESDSAKYNQLYKESVAAGKDFYCLTASSVEEIERWMAKTGAEYTFCHADDIMLKTMIRSNPGIMELKNGVVCGKWSHHDQYK
ncbi:MAG: redoxin domain-containing protein [Prevotellaceae bacterium]|nr:redoxin domain-containing protein [Prevotellaceae bacterium]